MKKIIILLALIPALCFAETKWEEVKSGHYWLEMVRTPVPNGWLVRTTFNSGNAGSSTIFVPDENHEWKL